MSKQQILMMSLVGSIIYLCFSGIILQYVNDLEENVCVCSNHWYREFIKYFTSLMVVIIIPYIFAQKKFLRYIDNNISILLLSIIKFVGIIYYAVLVKYFIMLKNTECKCSENWKRRIFLYPIIVFSLMMIVLIFFTTKATIKYVLN
jgi:hypothetical protein